MRIRGSRWRRPVGSGLFAVAVAVALSSATPLAAQARPLFDWVGTVDRDAQIVMHGGDLRTRNTVGSDQTERSARPVIALPRSDGVVTLRVLEGRGRVDVIQQPTRQNDYTTIIRVQDPQGGAARYRITAAWEPLVTGDRNPHPVNDGTPVWDSRIEPIYGRGGPDPVDERRRDTPRNDGYQTALQWRGIVDDEVELRLQGSRAEWRTIQGNQVQVQSSRVVGSGLPARSMDLRIERIEGRGTVDIIEQPSAKNGYVTLIRIKDAENGAGQYAFDLIWR